MQSTAFSLDWLPSMDERRLTIRGRYDRISDVRDFITEAAQAAGLNDQAQHHCQIAVDEACTNIIEHGYGGEDRGEIEIRCSSPNSETLVIELRDQAHPFDPTDIPEADATLSLDERAIGGGWGIYFMSKMMDEIGFKREGETNILRLTKYQADSE